MGNKRNQKGGKKPAAVTKPIARKGAATKKSPVSAKKQKQATRSSPRDKKKKQVEEAPYEYDPSDASDKEEEPEEGHMDPLALQAAIHKAAMQMVRSGQFASINNQAPPNNVAGVPPPAPQLAARAPQLEDAVDEEAANLAERAQFVTEALGTGSSERVKQAKAKMYNLIKDAIKHELWRQIKIIENPDVRKMAAKKVVNALNFQSMKGDSIGARK
jgi:hypothetical protein